MPVEIIECEQNTPEWFEARRGIVTASMFATVMAKGRGGGVSKTREKYMRQLAGEIIIGIPMDNFSNAAMAHGHEVEPEARAAYEFLHDAEVELVGFLRNGTKGCSPDGLVGTDGMVEIKRKAPHLLIEVWEDDRLPPEHVAQVQGQLWVAEREWADFVAHFPGMPTFTKRVTRDEAYISNLAVEVGKFQKELDALVEKVRGFGSRADG